MTQTRERQAAPIERATSSDLVMLMMDRRGGTPEQLGAVLVLDPAAGTDAAAVEDAIAERIRRIPRLRQRLVRVPPGCGRPVWIDDPDFDVTSRTAVALPGPRR